MDEKAELLRLRAFVVRIAHEVEAICDDVGGKKAARARADAESIARRMRFAAMSPGCVEACKR